MAKEIYPPMSERELCSAALARRAAAETGCKKGEIYRLLTVQNSR